MDPATGLDAVRNVGISGGKIVAISEEPLTGTTVVNVSNHVVAPGFIDIHAHGQTTGDMQIKACDGVSTALDMEAGMHRTRSPCVRASSGYCFFRRHNSRMKFRRLPFALCLSFVCAVFLPCIHADTEGTVPRIDVLLWFDTEDYLLPADDDACLRLADMLGTRGIRSTFKVVGEKARVLEGRGRHDVIAALKKHDIGYHANFHSVHPTPTEYLAECGLLDGMAEFARREGGGAADVRRIFGVKTLSCYGQPGSSWGPQAHAALKDVGIAPSGVPCYVDEGSHVGLDNRPFWYCGALNVFNMGNGRGHTRMDLHDPAALEPAKKTVSTMAARLAREDGGGLISIYYHPCEWVHQKFWDGVNFSRGANPPREEWKAPPQRTAGETEGAFQRFGEYIDHIRTIPGARFITASELPLIYPDAVRSEGATGQELAELAQRILTRPATGVDFQRIGRKAFSPADQFELLTLAVGQHIDGKKPEFPITAHGLLGPDNPPPAVTNEQHLGWPAFRAAALDVRGFIQTQRRVPARVFIGAEAVAPADFLTALASAYDSLSKGGTFPQAGEIPLGANTEVLPARHIAKDTPNLFGGWVIHKEGFRAPKVLEVARLQAWTLKPAVRKD